MHRLLPVAVLLVAVPLAAAPVPKDTETPAKKLERLFGTPVSPERATVALANATLRVTAEKRGDFVRPLECPRTRRRVVGDFTLTVSVTQASAERGVTWSGLYAADGDGQVWASLRALDTTGPEPIHRIAVENWVGGKVRGPAVHDEGAGRPKVAHLRLSRDGATLSADFRYPGGEWQHLARKSVGDATVLDVGVWAGGAESTFTAEFEDFKLTPRK